MPNYFKYLLITCAACLLFIPFIGHVHLFDWDEINFAECAREMIVSKDYLRAQIDFMPFWEKPPFFIWMQVLSMKLFGVGEFAARFPNAAIGVITMITLFYAGKRIVNERMAMWWVALYAASWLPHFYFKSGIIDPTFNFFIFLSFFQFHLVRVSERRLLHCVLSGLFLGMAVLTKGPVAILVASLALLAYMVVSRGLNGYSFKEIFIVAFFAFIPVLAWLGAAVASYGLAYGKWFVSQFLLYQVRLFRTEDSDHGGPFFYHFVVLLVGCFPASIFLFQYSKKRVTDNSTAQNFTRLMWILFWVVLILFSIVKTKIVHYSSLCYFPLTYLAAIQIDRMADGAYRPRGWVKAILLVIGSVIALLITALPLVGIYSAKLTPYIADPFVVGNLRAVVPWSMAECLWGLLYLIGVWVAVLLMNRNFYRSMVALCLLQIVIIQITVIHFTPKIEEYTQGSAIRYYQSFAGRDVYVRSLGFKSYGSLFYSRKQPSHNPNYVTTINKEGKKVQPEVNEIWLIYGNTDKPTFFICKVQDSARNAAVPQLSVTGSSNGYVFFQKK